MDWKHKRQSKIVKATLGAAVLGTLLGGYGTVWAADNIVVDGTQDGSKNAVEADKSARVVGTENTVNKGSEEVKIVGDGNTVTNSDRELIFGDDNSIIDRDIADTNGAVRANNVSDIIVGKGNTIQGHATWGERDASATIIGNNNTGMGVVSGVVIGDNQEISGTSEAVIIGALSAEQRKQGEVNAAGYNVVIGYGTVNNNGRSVVIGHRATAGGTDQTVVGNGATFERDAGRFGSIYGVHNHVYLSDDTPKHDPDNPRGPEGQPIDGNGTHIIGAFNNAKAVNLALIYGSGNSVSHAEGYKAITNEDMDGGIKNDMNEGIFTVLDVYSNKFTGDPLAIPMPVTYEQAIKLMRDYARVGGGNMSVLGSGNMTDFAQRSRILGDGNVLTGDTDIYSTDNTISGFLNTGEKINNSTIIGSSNTIKNSEDNVVLGDYHSLDGGKHNIIIGSSKFVENDVERKLDLGKGFTYTVTERTAEKPHTENISNAVMLGYNTDVSQNGGVALGSESVGSVGANNTGGYNVGKNENSFKTGADTTWNSNLAAISVGDSSDTANVKTRQITNLAAGKNDTDAVNVAQLKSARIELTGGTNISIKPDYDVNDGHLKYIISSTGGSSEGGSGTTYTPGDNISITDGIISAKDTRNTLEAGDHVVLGETMLTDGSIKYKVNVKADGKVESGNTGLVTGGAIYNETRVSKDGNYVKRSNTTGQNLVALDGQVKTNTDSIQSINSQITDMNSSVANLGNQVNRLDNRIERVGAGAAALAALHPQDFDPDAKWDIAAGYGHYRSANAVAIGAFYRPSTDMMFSIGTSLGGGENMINAGVSLKLGSSSPYTGYSRAALANVVAEQSEQLNAQSSTISELREKVELQAQENEALRTQVQDIMRQLAEIKK